MEISIELSEKIINRLSIISDNEGCTISDLIEESILNYRNISLVDLNSPKFSYDVKSHENNINIKHPYYVYVYLNPNIKGTFEYLDYKFDYQPVYVGKGVDSRNIEHLNQSNNSKLNNFIKWLSDRKQEPMIEIIESGLSSLNAHRIEGQLIGEIGRLDKKHGPLFNNIGGVEYNNDETHTILEDSKVSLLLSTLNTEKKIKETSIKLGMSERTIYRMKKRYNIQKVNGVWTI